MESGLKNLILELYEIQSIKFGSFTLKSGILSPIYLDLRMIISYPRILKQISDELLKKVKDLSFDMVCGVPYTALPIATCFSVTSNFPMLMRRKEAKDYGTKKIIEGVFQKGQTCLIIEDVITSGASISETIEPLQNEGLLIKDIIVVIDREQGGRDRLEEKGLHLHSLFTISELLHVLEDANKIDGSMVESVKEFLKLQSFAKVKI